MEHIKWRENRLILLDQRLLPGETVMVTIETAKQAAEAIRDMIVRGAPAIGITAAYGMALAAFAGDNMDEAAALLGAARPTAVNLHWAIDRMMAMWQQSGGSADAMEAEAVSIHAEDIAMNRDMGFHGASLFDQPVTMLTHCNAGALATGGYGTALGVIRSLHRAGKLKHVYADETRPYLQGARITAFELAEDGIPHSVITDNTAGLLMARGEIDAGVVGADRIAANGDTANKIGTLMVAVCAKRYDIPFYVAAPYSTFDAKTATGAEIPIEERGRDEVAVINGKTIVPDDSNVLHFGFDVTPADLITGFITERGVLQPPFDQ